MAFAEGGAGFLDFGCEGDLDVAGYGFFALGDSTTASSCRRLGFADHALYALDGCLTFMERAGDFLGQCFDYIFLSFLHILVFEAWENVFLMKLVELHGLFRDSS